MKKFKGKRNLDEIKKLASQKGYEVDTSHYDRGGDHIWLRDMKERMLQIMYNVVNGHFAVFCPASDKPIATHESKDLDNESWYVEILDIFYY